MGDGHKQLQLRNWDSATDDRAQCWQTKSKKAKAAIKMIALNVKMK